MRAGQAEKTLKFESDSEQNEGAQMSNELESESAMVVMELWWRF